ncbi:MAG: hypothetical protein E7L17_10740 [Clostridium sp.]|uniref:hypothetical protein n=1 Tax=Clostridium sp. TaxID=1506 RepID=UPI0029137B29|nr:hypothetical protein [Clostridium sp.]MDU7338576.1 hypothetical protein [Clostridium sp.]
MDAQRYLREKERLSQALNGEDRLDGAVDAITAVLKDHNIDLMPLTALDVFCHTLETLHLAKLNLSEYTQ